ncbi:MAG TPA: hypothetical protein VJB99_03560 [Patescibacteria group bacterium]|nr:hypothetical protein [Patescibacteria group bacterium]
MPKLLFEVNGEGKKGGKRKKVILDSYVKGVDLLWSSGKKEEGRPCFIALGGETFALSMTVMYVLIDSLKVRRLSGLIGRHFVRLADGDMWFEGVANQWVRVPPEDAIPTAI